MIELRMLGSSSLSSGDGREVDALIGQRRRFALLAHLAAAVPRGLHRRDTLMAMFWPELDQEHARTALRQALHVLREALGTPVLVGRGDVEVGLDFGELRSDVDAFDQAIDAGQWREALDLYRGPLLDGFFIADAPEFERWLETERARLRDAAARAARVLAERSEARGDLTTAAHWSRRAMALAPDDEGLVRRLIMLLDLHGERAGALHAYQEFADRIADEYDAQPAAETKALVAAVRARERVKSPGRPQAVDLRSRLSAALADRYRVERELAHGRKGTVFLGHDLRHNRGVAIKVLHPELAAAVDTNRFLSEIAFAAQLRHPRIVPLYDSGDADGMLYFVMPYIKGDSLRDRLKREQQLPISDAICLSGEVAEALDYAHRLGVLHRDVKPENILIEDGHAFLADFGIARAISAAGDTRLTETGISLGTPAYMSPEQATGAATVDGRSDVYSLGCVIYEMLTGAPPFTGPTAQAVLARHVADPAPPIRTVRDTVPAAVEGPVLRALAKVPADRYRTAGELAVALTMPTSSTDTKRDLSRVRRTRGAIAAGMVVLVAALLAVSGARGWRSKAQATPGNTWMRSLAVLPLENLAGDTSADLFADGMTAALISDLGRLRALRVMSRQSVSPFKGTRRSTSEIGRALHVDVLMEGTIQQSLDSVRIDLQLIDARSGRQLWTQRFEDGLQHRFAVQESIWRSVAAALKLPIDSAEQQRLRTVPTTSPEAYELLLRGRVRVRHQTIEDNTVAIQLFERAATLDPSFALAQASLAGAYLERVAQYAPSDSESLERAYVAIEKALILDPNLADAHVANARLLWGATRQFAHEQSVREDRRALLLNPNLETAHAHLAFVYLHVGLLEKAVSEFEKALALDPQQWMAQERIGQTRLIQGRYTEGLRLIREVPTTESPPLRTYDLVWALTVLGNDSEAAAVIGGYLRDHPEDRGGVLTSSRAILWAKRGDARSAEADIQSAIRRGAGYVHFHHTEYNIAVAYALLRQPAMAVPWLQRTAAEGFPCYPLFANDPRLNSIRKDPAFIAFLRDQRAQWERYRDIL